VDYAHIAVDAAVAVVGEESHRLPLTSYCRAQQIKATRKARAVSVQLKERKRDCSRRLETRRTGKSRAEQSRAEGVQPIVVLRRAEGAARGKSTGR